jgi:hypothetical protein
VDIKTAIAAGTTLFKNIGKHSIAKALAKRRVDSNK